MAKTLWCWKKDEIYLILKRFSFSGNLVDFHFDSIYTECTGENLRHANRFYIQKSIVLTLGTRIARAFFLSLTRKEKQTMDYGMIGKIEKAKRYAQERDRVHFEAFTVKLDGDNNGHTVHYQNGEWDCDCDFFKTRGRCSHTMAMEMILEHMIPQPLAQ